MLLFFCLWLTAFAAQATPVLHITVTLGGRPLPRYALLISDDPVSAAPRRVVTGVNGTVDVRLRPGAYIVESDQPAVFQGKAYQWAQPVVVPAGKDATLELTADNATTEAAAQTGPSEADLGSLFEDWKDSVVTVWSETSVGSGFLIDANGLIATNQHVLGTSTAAQVQLNATTKVEARVLASDAKKDVAILWIDPKVAATIKPVRLAYTATSGSTAAAASESPLQRVTVGQPVFTVGVPMRDRRYFMSGTISRVTTREIETDVVVDRGNSGGPLFGADGGVIGITILGKAPEQGGSAPLTILRVDEVRDTIAQAGAKTRGMEPPKGIRLPVEAQKAFSETALAAEVGHRAGSLNPYTVTAGDFDMSFVTPVQLYAAQVESERAVRRGRGSAPPAFEDFGTWGDYVSDFPPVLLIHATPKLVAGFWQSVGRAAAQTQGVALPASKHFKGGFLRMRAYCGDTEVIPIHPFRVEHHLEAMVNGAAVNDSTFDGLYAFDPASLGPQCGTVKLVLFGEKDPDKGDTRVVDPKIIEQIRQDFAAAERTPPRP